MTRKQGDFPGDLEQMVLLAILQLGDQAFAIQIREELLARAQRRITRGALYRTLDRMEEKGWLRWKVEEPSKERGGHHRRRFEVTPDGLEVLRTARRALDRLSRGLGEVLGV